MPMREDSSRSAVGADEEAAVLVGDRDGSGSGSGSGPGSSSHSHALARTAARWWGTWRASLTCAVITLLLLFGLDAALHRPRPSFSTPDPPVRQPLDCRVERAAAVTAAAAAWQNRTAACVCEAPKEQTRATDVDAPDPAGVTSTGTGPGEPMVDPLELAWQRDAALPTYTWAPDIPPLPPCPASWYELPEPKLKTVPSPPMVAKVRLAPSTSPPPEPVILPAGSGPVAGAPKKRYRAIVVVLSSSGNDGCLWARRVWELYMHTAPELLVVFQYGHHPNNAKLEASPNNLIFPTIEENYNPGMMRKNIATFAWLQRHYEYDYIIRTNLGAFWNLRELLRTLDRLPRRNAYAGHWFDPTLPGNGWAVGREATSGVSMIFSAHLIHNFVAYRDTHSTTDFEDLVLGRWATIAHGLPIIKVQWAALDDFRFSSEAEPLDAAQRARLQRRIEESVENHTTHYRLVNMGGTAYRYILDAHVHLALLQRIYNVTVPFEGGIRKPGEK